MKQQFSRLFRPGQKSNEVVIDIEERINMHELALKIAKQNKIGWWTRLKLYFQPLHVSVDFAKGPDRSVWVEWKQLDGKVYILNEHSRMPNYKAIRQIFMKEPSDAELQAFHQSSPSYQDGKELDTVLMKYNPILESEDESK